MILHSEREKKDTIFMTGGTGFLGRNLIRDLLSRSRSNLVLLTRDQSKALKSNELISEYPGRVSFVDVGNWSGIETAFADHDVSTILHLATNYGRDGSSLDHQLVTNLMLPVRLLEIGKKFGVKYFINTDTALSKLTSSYALSKSHFRDWLESFSADFVCINMILEHFYGEFDDNSKFVTFLIDSMLSENPVLDLTSGEQKRNFIYIKDVVQSYMVVISEMKNHTSGFYQYGVGSDHQIAIKDLVLAVRRLTQNTKTKLNFGARPLRTHEVMESCADFDEIKRLGWKPEFSLEQGLSLTIEMEKNRRGLN